jgi:hypothetical protein
MLHEVLGVALWISQVTLPWRSLADAVDVRDRSSGLAIYKANCLEHSVVSAPLGHRGC